MLIYSLILNFLKEPVLVLWLWFSKFSKNRFLVCDCGSQKLWRSQRIGQRLVMKTLNPKTGERPFHKNLHFFEVFEIIRTDNSLLPIFFSQRNETDNYLMMGHSNHENQWFFKNSKKNHPTLLVTSVIMWDESWRVMAEGYRISYQGNNSVVGHPQQVSNVWWTGGC